jgi:hypothetical protein
VPPASETSRPVPRNAVAARKQPRQGRQRVGVALPEGAPTSQGQSGDDAFNIGYRVAGRADPFRVHSPPSRREDFALVRSGSTAAAPVAPNAEDFAPVLPWNDVAGSAVLRGHIGPAKSAPTGMVAQPRGFHKVTRT